jgi:ubiquitin-protein ligase
MAQAVSRRQVRLEKERVRLQAVNQDSDCVKVIPVDPLPGRAPERYRFTFLCQGITGIDSGRNPIYGTQHNVVVYCHEDFPADVPWLRWETPIWHPNIEHYEPKNVCVNKREWLGGMTLVDLCQQLFEMVQYKNYHAEHSPPYPLDAAAAVWVRDHAEPQGIVDKKRGIYVDNRPFYKPTASERISRVHILATPSETKTSPRIKIQSGGTAPSKESENRVILRAGAAILRCGACGTDLPGDSQFCDRCGAQVRDSIRRVKFTN